MLFAALRSFKNSSILLVLLAIPVFAAAESVVDVEIHKNGKLVQKGVGTLIAEEQVLISATLTTLGEQFIIKDSASGADVVGSLAAEAKDADLALLSVPGLTGEQMTVSLAPSEPGRNITLVMTGGKSLAGTIHSVLPVDDKHLMERSQHTALLGENEFSAPLLNNCGELLGISQSETRGLIKKIPLVSTTFGITGSLDAMKQFLTDQEVEFKLAGEDCLSVDTQLKSADKEVDALKQQQDDLEAEKTKIAEQKDSLETLSQEQKEELEKKEKELQNREDELKEQQEALIKEQEAKDAAVKKQAELEKNRVDLEQKGEKSNQEKIYIIAGAAILLLALIGVVIRRRRQLSAAEEDIESSRQELSQEKEQRQVVQSELEESKATFNDILLVGLDEEGKEHRIKINGNALIRSAQGQIIGRSAQDADYMVNLEQISRRHLRLTIVNGQVYVEDLKSFNGAAINGKDLTPGDPAPLANNDELRIGTINARAVFVE